jgi:hypothetical protein
MTRREYFSEELLIYSNILTAESLPISEDRPAVVALFETLATAFASAPAPTNFVRHDFQTGADPRGSFIAFKR